MKLGKSHALGLLGVGNGAILLDNLIDGDLVEVLQIETGLARLNDIADDVMHVAKVKEASGTATKVQITETIDIASAAIIQEVDKVIVVVEAKDHIVAPRCHDKDTLRTAKSGTEQLANAIVASILGSNNGHRFRNTQQSRVMIGLCSQHIVGSSGLRTRVQRLNHFRWFGTWWTFLLYY